MTKYKVDVIDESFTVIVGSKRYYDFANRAVLVVIIYYEMWKKLKTDYFRLIYSFKNHTRLLKSMFKCHHLENKFENI